MYVRILFFHCFILNWQNMSQLAKVWVHSGDEEQIEILLSDSEFDKDNYVVEDESEKDMAC